MPLSDEILDSYFGLNFDDLNNNNLSFIIFNQSHFYEKLLVEKGNIKKMISTIATNVDLKVVITMIYVFCCDIIFCIFNGAWIPSNEATGKLS